MSEQAGDFITVSPPRCRGVLVTARAALGDDGAVGWQVHATLHDRQLVSAWVYGRPHAIARLCRSIARWIRGNYQQPAANNQQPTTSD